jgi:Domain of unknown function (DUF1877)
VIGNLQPASDAEIERLLAYPEEITRFLYGSGSESRERVVLGKAWHAIHFALNGERLGGDEPLNFLVAEGTPVGEVDVGYGPARVFTSAQVREIVGPLQRIEPDELGGRLDPRLLDDAAIYPGRWQGDDGLTVDDVVSKYCEMRKLICRLARSGRGLVLYIN